MYSTGTGVTTTYLYTDVPTRFPYNAYSVEGNIRVILYSLKIMEQRANLLIIIRISSVGFVILLCNFT